MVICLSFTYVLHKFYICFAYLSYVLDSENLGEHVNDNFHNDFGDNKFPYFKANAMSMQCEYDGDEDSEEEEEVATST